MAPLPQPAAADKPQDWESLRRAAVVLPDGARLSFIEAGNPDGPPLLLLHGITDSSRSFSLMAPFLSSWRLIIPDLRGHGASGKPLSSYTYDSFARDLEQFIDLIGPARCVLVGHSLGGLVAQALFARRPYLVQGMILISSASNAGPRFARDALHKMLELKKSPLEHFRLEHEHRGASIMPSGFIRSMMRDFSCIPDNVLKAIARGLDSEELPALPKRQIPVCIIWGTDDQIFDAAHQERLKATFPHAEFSAFACLGHNPHWESPEAVALIMRSFINRMWQPLNVRAY